MNRNWNTFFLGLFFVYVTHTFANKEFAIDPIQQDKSLWCWAACCEMVFDAYKLETYGFYGYVDQYDIAVELPRKNGHVTKQFSSV